MQRDSNRYRMLGVIAEKGPITSTDAGLQLGITARLAANHVANLVGTRLVSVVGETEVPKKGKVRLYAITDQGREKLAHPFAKATKPVLDDALSAIRKRYVQTHAEHVERQRKPKAPEPLTPGEPIEFVSPAVR